MAKKIGNIRKKLTNVKEETLKRIKKINNTKKLTSVKKTDASLRVTNDVENEFIERLNIVENEKNKLQAEKEKIREEYKDLNNSDSKEIDIVNLETKVINKPKKVVKVSAKNKTITLDDINNALQAQEKKNTKNNTSKKVTVKKETKASDKKNVSKTSKKKESTTKKRKGFLKEFFVAVHKANSNKKKTNKENKTKKSFKEFFKELKIDFGSYFNKDTTLFVVVIVIFLFVFVCMLLPMPEDNEISSRVKSNLVDTTKMTGIEKFETSIENAIVVKFPWYEEILDGYFGAMEASNRKLYENANDNELILIDSKNGIYIDKNEDHLIRKYEVEEKDQDVELAHRVKLFNAMAKLLKKNNVNAYIYAVSGIWTSEAILNFELDYKEPLKYVLLFEDKIDDYINFDYLKIIDYTTFKKYFFATDHHWRIYGAYQAYKDICDMFEIPNSELVKPNYFKVEDVEFMGSNAKFCSYDNIVDYIYDIEFDDSRFTVKVNGEEIDNEELSKKKDYLEGEFEKEDKYFNHYAKYFHSDLAEIVYTFEENKDTNKNLLIIGDSYSNCIDKEIASHFYKTYVIDLRYYEEVFGEKFVLENYIKDDERNITDALIMLSANSVYFESADLDLGIEGVSGVKENRETN